MVGPSPVTWSHTVRPHPDTIGLPAEKLMEEEEAQTSLPDADWEQI